MFKKIGDIVVAVALIAFLALVPVLMLGSPIYWQVASWMRNGHFFWDMSRMGLFAGLLGLLAFGIYFCESPRRSLR